MAENGQFELFLGHFNVFSMFGEQVVVFKTFEGTRPLLSRSVHLTKFWEHLTFRRHFEEFVGEIHLTTFLEVTGPFSSLLRRLRSLRLEEVTFGDLKPSFHLAVCRLYRFEFVN